MKMDFGFDLDIDRLFWRFRNELSFGDDNISEQSQETLRLGTYIRKNIF